MKIAQVCPYDFSRPGGVKNHIESLSKYLRQMGHEVKIIAPNPNISEEGVYHFGGNRSLNLGGTKIDINIALGAERKALKNFLRNEQFDVIHFHTFWNPALPFQIRRFSRAKHVTTFHDTPKSQFVGKNIMPIAAKGVFTLMDAIISVSKTQAAYINRFSKREISIIPNGIDLAEYQQPIEPIKKYDDGKFNILFLGRLEERKGILHALESYKIVKKANPDIRLIIAGDGDERIQAENFIKIHELQDIEMLGFVSESEKLRLLKTADLYIAPALFGESFGIVLLEAMAMGTPMCGYGNEGYLNVLSEKQRAYFASPYDTESLAAKTLALISDQNEQSKMILEGSQVVQPFDWEILTTQIENVYKRVLKN
ncbi:glycosyltransferase family 4 protein [Marinoscillum pacificum]|uniref:glycosyltransferase family 4 protein n=1 Tax=Marinoscillum pacificum TaxID=392723 RepID=UPI0021582B14|nr:glycosyltransferase family 4 protein [Marinoscillum pacificum]